jgi:hypothetical protein
MAGNICAAMGGNDVRKNMIILMPCHICVYCLPRRKFMAVKSFDVTIASDV